MQLLAALLLSLSVIFVNALEDDELEEKPIQHPAKFTTLPQHSMVNAGGTIRLPCFVDKIEGYILLWKFGETILSVGGRVIDSSERKARLALEEERNGNHLVIAGARAEDSGEYLCQISDFVPRDIRHTVIVRTRPEVSVDTRRLVARAGENISLVCDTVAGHPVPEVSWTRAGDTRPLSDNNTLVLSHVTQESAGRYVCRADNGYSSDHRVSVSLRVEHSPVIDRRGQWVHSSQGGQAKVSCTVSSRPEAEVTWFRGQVSEDTQPLIGGLLYNMSRAEARDKVDTVTWTLEVNREADSEEDTQYACVASNSLGEDRMVVTLTSRPDKPFLKHNSTVFLWTVNSQPSVTEFLIEYKVVSEDDPGVYTTVSAPPSEGDQSPWLGSWSPAGPLPPGAEVRLRVKAVNTHGPGMFSDWLTVNIPAASSGVLMRGSGLLLLYVTFLVNILALI